MASPATLVLFKLMAAWVVAAMRVQQAEATRSILATLRGQLPRHARPVEAAKCSGSFLTAKVRSLRQRERCTQGFLSCEGYRGERKNWADVRLTSRKIPLLTLK